MNSPIVDGVCTYGSDWSTAVCWVWRGQKEQMRLWWCEQRADSDLCILLRQRELMWHAWLVALSPLSPCSLYSLACSHEEPWKSILNMPAGCCTQYSYALTRSTLHFFFEELLHGYLHRADHAPATSRWLTITISSSSFKRYSIIVYMNFFAVFTFYNVVHSPSLTARSTQKQGSKIWQNRWSGEEMLALTFRLV